MSALDTQEGGDHYKRMGVQPWEAFEAWLTLEQHQGYLLGTAIAYLARFNSEGVGKGGIIDVKKAIHCLQRMVEISEASMPKDPGPMPAQEGWKDLLGATALHYVRVGSTRSVCGISGVFADKADTSKPICASCQEILAPQT